MKTISHRRPPTLPSAPGVTAARARSLRTPALIALVLGCASCNFAPSYHRPSAALPPAFKETPADGASSGWQTARPDGDALRPNWWEIYQDPQLNALEGQVRISNQTILGAEANYRTSRALAVAARAALLPTLSTAPSVTRARSSATYSSSAGNSSTAATGGGGGSPGSIVNEYDLPFEASYVLDVWGRLRNSARASVYAAQANAADLAAAILSTQSQLAQDYFELRALDEERRILADTVTSYRQNLDLTRSLFRSGIDSDEDLATAQVQLDTAIAQGTDLGVARAQYEHAIAVLTGQPPGSFTLAPAPFKPATPAIPAGLPSDLLERRPDIASAERQVAAANAEIGVARTAYFPNLTLNADAGFESSHLSQWLESPSRFWAVGPELGAEIFPLGALQAVNEQAEASYDQTVATYRQTVLSALQGVEDNLAALRILAEESRQEETAVNSAAHYLALTMTRYRSGIDSSLNVAAAQTIYLANRETWVQVRLREVDASISLVVALGGGWDESLLPHGKAVTAPPPKWSPAS